MLQVVSADPLAFPQLQDLPPAATVNQLGSDERWNRLPEHRRIENLRARGYNNVWHGRMEELNRLHLTFPPRADNTVETNHEIMLAYGAQGSGKSAMLTRFLREAEQGGVATILLDQAAFRSEAEFLNHLTKSRLWKRATSWRNRRDRIVQALGAIGKGSLGAMAQATLLGEFGCESPAELSIIAQTTRMPLGRPDDAHEALRRLDDHCTHGFIFAVDEVQRWHTHPADTAAGWLTNLIGDPTIRQGADIRTGGLFLTGLTDSMAVLRDLDITRHKSMVINALDPISAHATLHDHLTGAGVEPQLTSIAEGRWLEVLTRDFGMWPHHTTCAATAAKHVLGDIQREWEADPSGYALDNAMEEGLDQTRTIAGRGVRELYEVRLGIADEHPCVQAVSDFVYLATLTDNTIAESTAEHIIREHRIRNKQVSDDRAVRDTLRELQHSGFLEPILTDQHARTGFLSVPIPSMAMHVIDTRTGPDVELVRAALAAPQREQPSGQGTPWNQALVNEETDPTE